MPEFRHRLVITIPTEPELVALWDLAGALGDEGNSWKFRTLGGRRYSFRFRREGHAALFACGATRRGLTTEEG